MQGAIRNTQYPVRSALWLVLIVTPLVLFWRVVFAGRVLFWGVPLLQFYPWQQFAVEMWRSGNVPLWNPFVGNGAPLAANLQSAVFYPLNVLYLILPVERAMSYTAVLHAMFAGLAMYAWARTLGLRPLAALIGALAFQLSQFYIARLGFLSITVTFPWTAVWLWRAEVLVRRPRLSDALWLALAIGLGLLAGHAQTAGLGLIVVAGYAAIRALHETRSYLLHLHLRCALAQVQVSAMGYLLIALAAGVALAAVQLLPSSELAAQSQRASGLDYEFAMTHSLHPLRLMTFLAPDLQGNPADGSFWGYDNYWENAGYVGVWALLMTAFVFSNLGAAREYAKSQVSSLKWIIWFFGATALVSLLIALGRFAPFNALLFRALPGAALFQGPARLLSAYTLAIAALAAIGTHQLLESDRLRFSGRLLVVAALGIVLAAIGGAFVVHVRAVFIRPIIQFGLTLAASAACLAFRPSITSLRFKWWARVLIGVITVDLLVADARLNPATDAALYHTPTAYAPVVTDGRIFFFDDDERWIKFERYLSFKSFGPEDTAYWLGLRECLLPDVGMIERVSSANNFDSLLPERYNNVMALVNRMPLTDALRLAGMMNARYIVSPRELPLPVVHRNNDVTIYRNDVALGRAWIVPESRVVNDPLAVLADSSLDLRRVVLLDSANAPALEFAAGPSSVTLRDSPNAVTIHVASESGGFLVLADTFYPGWQAMLDGKPVEILRANYAFRAVALPPGEHSVVFQYAPLSFRVGAAISLATLAVTVGVLIVLSLRRRV